MSDQTTLAALLHEQICEYHWPDLMTCGIDHNIDAKHLIAAGVRVTGDTGPEPAGFSISMSGEPYWSEGPGAPKIVRAVGNHRKGYRGVARFDCPHRHPTTGEAIACASAALNGVTGDAGLDVERLAMALRAWGGAGRSYWRVRAWPFEATEEDAAAIAHEYAALSTEEKP